MCNAFHAGVQVASDGPVCRISCFKCRGETDQGKSINLLYGLNKEEIEFFFQLLLYLLAAFLETRAEF